MDKQKLRILENVKSEQIELVDLAFSDLSGRLKSVSITPRELEVSLDDGKWFDGSSVEGLTRINESDMLLIPDPTTYVVLPYPRNGKRAARIVCDIYEPNRIPFSGAPRNVLRTVLRNAEEKGWVYNVGPEIEFFLLDSESEPSFHDKAGYLDFTPKDVVTEIRAAMVSTIERLGIPVELTHHEVAPSQHEIDIKYGYALKIADHVWMAKEAIKMVAASQNLHATFMPKLRPGVNGSGMHVHQSLFNAEGENLFYDQTDPCKLSSLARYFIGGQLEHVREMAAILCPTVNSYKRLVTGFEAPTYVCWGQRNRSALIRVPEFANSRPECARLELRCPDQSCNPYLAFAVMLAAGLRGIEEKIDPPHPVEEDVYAFDDRKLAQFCIRTLPADLGEAIQEFAQSTLMKETLGKHAFEKFLALRQAEWTEFKRSVTDWERDRYLDL
jgi:glutamine synthetase